MIGDGLKIAANIARFMFVWLLLLMSVLLYNSASEQAKGKCPEYQPVEGTFYKLKH